MIKGTYRFIQDGKVIATQENLLTTKGVQQILRLMTSQVAKIGESISIGVGNTAANVADEALQFETARAKISISSPDFATKKLVFKATLPADFIGVIYEVGLWSLLNNAYSGNYESRVLVSFDSATESWPISAEWITTNARIGKDAIRISPATSATENLTLDGVYIDLLGYSNSDELKLAYWVSSAFCANVKIKLMSSPSDYYTYTITTPSSGYHIQTFDKGDFTTTGSPTWASIISVDVSATATAGGAVNVDFDGLRIEDTDSLNPDYFLVSRAVRPSPLIKDTFAPMDIEYTLDASGIV